MTYIHPEIILFVSSAEQFGFTGNTHSGLVIFIKWFCFDKYIILAKLKTYIKKTQLQFLFDVISSVT